MITASLDMFLHQRFHGPRIEIRLRKRVLVFHGLEHGDTQLLPQPQIDGVIESDLWSRNHFFAYPALANLSVDEFILQPA